MLKTRRIIELFWYCPPPFWTKAYVDGTTRGNPGKAGLGAIFSFLRWFVKGSFAMPVGIENAFVKEALAFIQAIEIAHMKHWFPIWVQTDSVVLLSKVKNRDMNVPWKIKSKWRTCLGRIDENSFSMSHIYREGNAAANVMANLGCDIDDFAWWNSYPASTSSGC